MSQQEESVRGTIFCLLPEMVSSLRKDIYFFAPQVSYFFKNSFILKHIFQEILANSTVAELRSENERLRAELARRSQISSTPLELAPIYQEWKSFEFVTKKKGAYGPTKSECLSYYAEKYAYL